MSDNWITVKEEINAYRTHVKGLPQSAKEKAKHSFLITKDELDKLLALKGEGASLDGIRIHLGAHSVDGHIVPTVHVIAVEKDGSFYHDYGVPEEKPEPVETTTKLSFAADDATVSKFKAADMVPCPPTCNPKDPFGKG